MKVISRILPKAATSSKLFITGATVGPVVDSLHNQCLLTYGIAPITIPWPSLMTSSAAINDATAILPDSTAAMESSYLFCSSWLVPPLLGVAYVVLGGILPRVMQILIDNFDGSAEVANEIGGAGLNTEENVEQKGFLQGWKDKLPRRKSKMDNNDTDNLNLANDGQYLGEMKNRAIVAVLSTALIIKLSEFLETQQFDILSGMNLDIGTSNLLIMVFAAITQWATLDGTIAALLAATITSIGGPLSELPFVASGCWHYLPEASDYLPLSDGALGNLVTFLAGSDQYRDLALSSITGPCYFAVTMDAIALGRWFDAGNDNGST